MTRLVTVLVCLLLIGGASAPPSPGYSPTARPGLEPRLQRIIGRWYVTASTFGGAPDTTIPTFVATPAALGRAVYSVRRQGAGASSYEANAIWAYDSASSQIRVFEANSAGVAEMHVGTFDGSGALILELRSAAGGDVAQRRVFRWAGDTLHMGAQFIAAGRTTNHNVTLVRR